MGEDRRDHQAGPPRCVGGTALMHPPLSKMAKEGRDAVDADACLPLALILVR